MAVPVRRAVRPGETEDLASLTNLNGAILLDELKARYKRDDIYVRTPKMNAQKPRPKMKNHRNPTA